MGRVVRTEHQTAERDLSKAEEDDLTKVDDGAQTMRSNSIEEHRRLSEMSSHSSSHGQPMSEEKREQFVKDLLRSIEGRGGFRRGFLRQSSAKDNRARTVESPALSADLGRANLGIRLADTFSKAFHVKQGHYSDIYDRIDRHKPLSTKRPAQLLDEALARLVLPSRDRGERYDRRFGTSGVGGNRLWH